MVADITDEEWDALAPENFDTTTLLRAVDAIDEMRSYLCDGENGEPTELRTDLLRLHRQRRDGVADRVVGRMQGLDA